MARADSTTLVGQLRRFAGAPGSGVPDSQLLERFVGQGDQAAFELLVWRHEKMVLEVCSRVLRCRQEAEDVSQAAFLALACKAASIGKKEAVAGWLYKVAFRAALRQRAKLANRARQERLAALPDLDRAPEGYAEVSAQDARQIVHEEVHRLPEKYRSPVVLCYLEGQTNEEAARQLSCPTGTLVTRLARARQRLRGRLESRGLALSSAGMIALLASNASAFTASFRDRTVRAALAFALDQAGSELVSAKVALLTRGVLKTMLITRLRTVAVVLLSITIVGTGSGLLAHRGLADEHLVPLMPEPAANAFQNDDEPGGHKQSDGTKKGDAPTVKQADRHGANDPTRTAKEKVTKTFKTGKAPRIVVEMYNGGIEVTADSESGVQVEVTKHGSAPTEEQARQALQKVEVKMSQDGESVRVQSRQTDQERIPNSSSGASAELKVPAGSVLELQTRNGPVTVTGVKGKVLVETSNGAVSAKMSTGPLSLHTKNGVISVSGATGRLELKTSNGPIKIEADKAVVSADTKNGSVHFHGTFAQGEHTLRTSNGEITLYLPPDASFRMDADTSHGSIRTEFKADKAIGKNRAHLSTVVGDNPGTTIKLQTSNGNISIRAEKKKD